MAGDASRQRRVTACYRREAGLTGLTVLPIEDFGFWRSYQLTH
ncbi:hypothetical protein WEI85_38450 [Actinomycetes bacterium KLBMP 9797]